MSALHDRPALSGVTASQRNLGRGTDLTLNVGDLGRYTLLAVIGDMDASNTAWLSARLSLAIHAAANGVIVDLSEAGFCDASGISVLIVALRTCRDGDRDLAFTVAGPRGRVARVLAITGVDRELPLHPGLDSALRALDAATLDPQTV